MIVVDTNVLLHSVNSRAAQHEVANRWLTAQLSSHETIGLCWVVLLGFIRLATHRSVLPRPLTTANAFDLVDNWKSYPSTVLVEPTARHSAILHGLLDQAGTAGNLTTDAHIAAIAIEHGATVATFDWDFQRFGVKIAIPA